MSVKLVVGLEGDAHGDAALDFARETARHIGDDCELIVVYVIEWSPFAFQTPEENAERHKRREQEIETANTRIINPAIEVLERDGIAASGIVRHGHAADILELIADEQSAAQIIIARTGKEEGMRQRLLGSTATNLAMSASVPVTIV